MLRCAHTCYRQFQGFWRCSHRLGTLGFIQNKGFLHFRLDLDVYLHPAVGQALSHLHCSFSLTEITSQPSFDMKLMTPQNWPYLCSRSGLCLWSGIRLEAGQRIVTLLLVGLTVRAQCTHIMEAGLTSGAEYHCSFSAQSKFGAGDEAETPAYKGRRLTASRVTSNSITAGKAVGIFFEDKSHFQRILRLLKMLPLVLCY